MAAQSFFRQSQTVGGTGSFYDLMDAIHALFATKATKWRIVSETETSGARTFIQCAPLLASTLPDMRVVFAGKPSSATPIMQSPDTFLTGALHIGFSPEGGTGIFGTWDQGTNPYDTRFIGFCRCSAAATDFNEVIIHESEEILFMMIKTVSGGYYGFIVGAVFVSPASNDNEANGRIYGLITSGSSSISTSWHSNYGVWMDHSTNNGESHAFMFNPTTSVVWPLYKRYISRPSVVTDSTKSSNRNYDTISYQRCESPYWHIGELVGIKMGKGIYKTEIKEGSTVKWLCGSSSALPVDALMFKV